MSKRVVFTGVGVLAPNGKGKEEFWRALKEGRTGYGPATLFDAARFNTDQVGEVFDFDAKEYLGPKGLRNMDRSTRLMVCAGRFAVVDSGWKITEENTDDFGVSVGCTLGSIKSINDFDEVTLREGPRYTNPALFPNTVINSPASHVSIWENIQGFNSTLSTGFTSGIDAIKYAYDFIQLERAKAILAGGVEEMCLQTFFGFYAVKYLSGSRDGDPFICCPFDARRNGAVLGEGACLLAMEDYEYAKERGADILAEAAGFGYSFDTYRTNKYNPRATGLKRAIAAALEDAGLQAGDIDYICANANSTPAADRVETLAIKEVFGEHARKIPVSTIKSMTGECFSVSGALMTAAALGAIREGFIPPTVNYKEPDPDCDLDYVPNESRAADLRHVLIITFGPNGGNSCMVIRRMDDE